LTKFDPQYWKEQRESERELNLKLKKKLVPLAMQAGVALLFVDTRQPHVDVPTEHLKQENKCFGVTYQKDQGHLPEVNDHGVRASLDFHGRRHRCFFPWDSIHGLVVQPGGSSWGFLKPPAPKDPH
jgi:hypothetical protein